MINPDITNNSFQLAAGLVDQTAQHIFLTGKAGTGKTTFLKYIREATHKNCVVIAPTGVAAIQAGGVTMHSFFQLPFEPFIPARGSLQHPLANQSNLFSKIQLSSVKREVMEDLELMIIDEVSMVRCDQLDAIDLILRSVRKNQRPFGGVQVLFIGDLYQLPPVIKEDEWQILREYYEGPYFFHSKVAQASPPLYIELKKIYRQKEQQFIDLLNHIRHNDVQAIDFELLHSRYQPGFEPGEEEKYITITTHNFKADTINKEALKKLQSPEFIFRGEIDGEFSDKMLPTELHLVLKKGAQVMFIKNDTGEDRRYFNGKLATISSISREEIVVTMNDDGTTMTLEKEEWENIRYSLNKDTGNIQEETLGTFQQYPIRLAWAITIHKSQGLTFQNVIVDAGQSFAPGQVYVALSRCTTLEGMVLLSRITSQAIGTDQRIVEFSERALRENELGDILQRERKIYLAEKLIEAFRWEKFVNLFEAYAAYLSEKHIPEKYHTDPLTSQLLQSAKVQQKIAGQFREKIPGLIELHETQDSGELTERVTKAIHWFGKHTQDEILTPLSNHFADIEHASKLRQYKKYVAELVQAIELHLKKLFALRYGEFAFCPDPEAYKNYIPQQTIAKTRQKNKKAEKGETQKITLGFFKDGLSIEEIAVMRNLAVSTIESHLGKCVITGELDIHDLIPAAKLEAIVKIIDSTSSRQTSDLKYLLGDNYSYAEIRAVLHWKFADEQNP